MYGENTIAIAIQLASYTKAVDNYNYTSGLPANVGNHNNTTHPLFVEDCIKYKLGYRLPCNLVINDISIIFFRFYISEN